MGSHACDRVLRYGVILALLAALAGCSGRSTKPEDHQTEPTIHDPFDNEEAELLALNMSGELCAPEDLYEQVKSNLATIRGRWGDSIPRLLTITYRPFWSPSYLSLGADGDAVDDMENGTYTAWDSLNEYYHLDQVIISHSGFDNHRYVALSFTPRLDPRRLTEAYAGLPGIGYIQPAVPIGDWSCVYGGLHGSTATYLFRHGWGDCPAGCTANEFWYFRAYGDSAEYVGRWAPQDGTPHPVWWGEASTNWENYRGDDILWERTDSYIPTAVADLRAENPGSNEVTLAWTAPADSSYTPRVGSYIIAYASMPITEETWKGARHVDGPPPSLPGVHESFRVTGLTSDTHFYFAIKSRGSDGSESPISNTVGTATEPALGWSTFDSTNTTMPASWINTMTADNWGGVWIATSQGLAHFDGSQWYTYDDVNAPAAGEVVSSMAADAMGNVWFVTSRGVHLFDGAGWRLYTQSDIGAQGTLFRVAVSPSGDVWVGGLNFVVAKFDGVNWTVIPPPIENPAYVLCWSIAADAFGNTWVATLGLGVFRYDGGAWTMYSKSNSGLGSNSVQALTISSDGTVWMSHDGYYLLLSRFDGTAWEQFSDYSGLPINSKWFIMSDSSDRLWIASMGVTRFDGTAWTNCKTTTSGLISDNVRSIVEDTDGNMWFGTDNGVSRLAAGYVEQYFGAESESSSRFTEAGTGIEGR